MMTGVKVQEKKEVSLKEKLHNLVVRAANGDLEAIEKLEKIEKEMGN